MRSMTGYGKSTVERNNQKLTIELKSVNNRFLDVNCKLPRAFLFLDDALRKALSAGLVRGRVDVYLTYEDKRETARELSVDIGLAKSYYGAAKKIAEELGIANGYTVTDVIKSPDVLRFSDAEQNDEELSDMFREALSSAIIEIEKMRAVEGEAMKADISARLENIESIVGSIKQRAPFVAKELGEKLRARITEILSGVEVDESKLLGEVAFYSDKVNIDEELARLTSHVSQLRSMLASEEDCGKKLDFLVQEFNREANTICSKSNDQQVTRLGLSLKNEIEKIREQIQNIV